MISNGMATVLDPAMSFRNYSSVASLVLLLWDYSVTCESEVQYVWRSPINGVKFIYFFSRYFVLVVQTANIVIMSLPMSRVPIDPATCRTWFVFLFVSCAMLSAALDFVLMLRVYALYKRSLKVALMLLTVFSVQTIAATIAGHSSIHYKTFNDTCDLNGTPYESAFLGGAVIATQSVIWSMTLAKRNVVMRQPTPPVGFSHRDGNYVFILICAIVIFALPYSFTANMARAHVIFIWPQAFFSIAACRIIINMQRLQQNDFPNPSIGNTSVHLSTTVGYPRANSTPMIP